jgi:hypothetical protein
MLSDVIITVKERALEKFVPERLKKQDDQRSCKQKSHKQLVTNEALHGRAMQVKTNFLVTVRKNENLQDSKNSAYRHFNAWGKIAMNRQREPQCHC